SVVITPEVATFLAAPRVATIATLDATGAPRQAPIWFRWIDDAAWLFTGRKTLKWRNIERDPRVSLSIDDRLLPYRAVILDGRAESRTDRELFPLVLDMALAYYGETEAAAFAEDYRRARPDVVVFRIEPTRVT